MNKTSSKGLSTKAIKARAWFQEFVRTSGDSMPHEDKVCLPACLKKKGHLQDVPSGYGTYEEPFHSVLGDLS